MDNDIQQERPPAADAEQQLRLKAFFQGSQEYYLDKVEDYEAGRKFSFHPYACLFGIAWYMYRKLYWQILLVGAIILGQMIIELIVVWAFDITDLRSAEYVSGIMAMITSAVMANYLYVRKALRQVRKAGQKYKDEASVLAYLHKKGGTSYALFFLLLLILTTVATCLSA